MKLNEAQIEDLTGKVFRTIINNGKEGILQSDLWKELDLTSRDGSRVAIRLEKRSLIRREKILESGRWTYKLFAVKLPAGTKSIESAPCLTCPVEHMCSLEGSYSPTNCSLIEDWLVTSFNSVETAPAQIPETEIEFSSGSDRPQEEEEAAVQQQNEQPKVKAKAVAKSRTAKGKPSTSTAHSKTKEKNNNNNKNKNQQKEKIKLRVNAKTKAKPQKKIKPKHATKLKRK